MSEKESHGFAEYVKEKIDGLSKYYVEYSPNEEEYKDIALETFYEIIVESNNTSEKMSFDAALKEITEETSHEKPTQAQLNTIGFIEANLHIEFSGVTKQQATEFISENIELSKNAVTTKQQSVIDMIESNTGAVFEGVDKADAQKFISVNIDSSVSSRNKKRQGTREYSYMSEVVLPRAFVEASGDGGYDFYNTPDVLGVNEMCPFDREDY